MLVYASKLKLITVFFLNNYYFLISYYFLFYPYMVEKILFCSQIFEIEILINLHVLSSSESENHIFNDWSVVRVSMCFYLRECVFVSICVSVISITQNKSQQKFQIWCSTIVSYVEAILNFLCRLGE